MRGTATAGCCICICVASVPNGELSTGRWPPWHELLKKLCERPRLRPCVLCVHDQTDLHTTSETRLSTYTYFKFVDRSCWPFSRWRSAPRHARSRVLVLLVCPSRINTPASCTPRPLSSSDSTPLRCTFWDAVPLHSLSSIAAHLTSEPVKSPLQPSV